MKTNFNELYRMPWTQTENAMTWLEVTRNCDLSCEYCCQDHDPKSHKSLSVLQKELEALSKLRSFDTVIIGGGEPLTHPRIVDITAMVAAFGVKPIILTNGVRLNKELTVALKKAGLFGFTFHIDAKQNRPGWRDVSETELNALRQRYADMVRNVGGLHCSYNMVVFPSTLGEVPSVIEWTRRNNDRVHAMMTIAGRTVTGDDKWDYYVDGEKVSLEDTAYASEEYETSLMSEDLAEQVKTGMPEYAFNSFLGGTADADSTKWAFGIHIASKRQSFGNLGPRSMDFLQRASHFFRGRYFSNISTVLNRLGGLVFLAAFFDSGARRAAFNYFLSVLKKPAVLFERIHLQSIIVMQPMDFLESGKQNDCEGCPNMTVWNGKLVNACHMESNLLFGAQFETVPKAPGFLKEEWNVTPLMEEIIQNESERDEIPMAGGM